VQSLDLRRRFLRRRFGLELRRRQRRGERVGFGSGSCQLGREGCPGHFAQTLGLGECCLQPHHLPLRFFVGLLALRPQRRHFGFELLRQAAGAG